MAKHEKHGHDVALLSDLRRLDLEQIDAVGGRGASWYYPAAAALSGAGAGLVISGGEAVTTVSGGAAAAPGLGAVTGAFVGDAAAFSHSLLVQLAISRCSMAMTPRSRPRSFSSCLS